MTREEKLQKKREEYRANKARYSAYYKAYRASRKAEISARNRLYREKNRERIAATKAEWTRLNPDCNRKASEAYRKRNREACGDRIKNWKARNTDLIRLQTRQQQRKRRALVRGCRVGRVDYPAIYKRDRGICHLCGKTPEKYHFDHVIPISKGGPHTAENIKVACAFCNLSKGNRIAA